jgi:hypothetical protein
MLSRFASVCRVSKRTPSSTRDRTAWFLPQLRLEERFLLRELPGYAEYTARVRFRLIPGIWQHLVRAGCHAIDFFRLTCKLLFEISVPLLSSGHLGQLPHESRPFLR